ncbi:DUF4355 domain-containing protein [Micromonospora sp. NPDC048999]|uniref:capsid assembly scaffolding protein Gp46 family protein n=1 Tax=Micromonospora sp. NPDC048999 TaxID=3155391 RepID=UPI0033F9041A
MGTENDGGNAGGAGTFTQADVDRIVRERLARDREKYADYDDLRAKAAEADKSKSALDKLVEKVSGLEDRAAKAERRALITEVASAKGLTAAQAKRLAGETREELERDADELLAAFRPADKDGKDGKDADGGKDGAGDGKDSDGGKDGAGDGKGSDGGKDAGGTAEGGEGGEARKLPPAGTRPKEKLTSGAVPGASGEKSAAEMADEILKNPF